MTDLPAPAPAIQQLVAIVNKCFVCNKPFSTPQKLRTHFKQHNIVLPERSTSIRHYNTPRFVYTKVGATEHHPLIEEHSGCPSCIAHFKELKDIKKHIVNNHPQAMPLQSRQKR
ncbi:unnamed protein product [Mucor hiemalis]